MLNRNWLIIIEEALHPAGRFMSVQFQISEKELELYAVARNAGEAYRRGGLYNGLYLMFFPLKKTMSSAFEEIGVPNESVEVKTFFEDTRVLFTGFSPTKELNKELAVLYAETTVDTLLPFFLNQQIPKTKKERKIKIGHTLNEPNHKRINVLVYLSEEEIFEINSCLLLSAFSNI